MNTLKYSLLVSGCLMASSAIMAADRVDATEAHLTQGIMAANTNAAAIQLVKSRVLPSNSNVTIEKFQQTYQGVPVWGQVITRRISEGQDSSVFTL